MRGRARLQGTGDRTKRFNRNCAIEENEERTVTREPDTRHGPRAASARTGTWSCESVPGDGTQTSRGGWNTEDARRIGRGEMKSPRRDDAPWDGATAPNN